MVKHVESMNESREPRVVTLDSSGALLHLQIMVKAGSAADPPGQEGLAYLTANALVQCGFGDAAHPVTRDRLEQIVRSWGDGAQPSVYVGKENATFSIVIPRERFEEYKERVLGPLLTRPLFLDGELDRLREETMEEIRQLRSEVELVGLYALDSIIHEGTSYGHPEPGTILGLERIDRDAVLRFYRSWYRPDNTTVAVNSSETAIVQGLRRALAAMGERYADVEPLPSPRVDPPRPVLARHLTVIGLPQADATGIHAGFPISVVPDDDYWPLLVANVWFGAHRDSFAHLFKVFRAERGYNYGDYSYIEHFEGRPLFTVPPPNTPRRYQYFSIWIRPLEHRFAHHVLRAMTWELEQLVSRGLTEEDVDAAKTKARVLYLDYAETVDRLLSYKLDDEYYGRATGYLEQYLARVDAVTMEAVNTSIRRHLQAQNVHYLVVTDQDLAHALVEEVVDARPAAGKTPADYQLELEDREGVKRWLLSDEQLAMLRRDALWEAWPLNIPRPNVRVVPVEQLFETAALTAPARTSGARRRRRGEPA
jgi:zinc protease